MWFYRVQGCRFSGLGFRVYDSGCRVSGIGFGVMVLRKVISHKHLAGGYK